MLDGEDAMRLVEVMDLLEDPEVAEALDRIASR
jgi:hypothetical protein